MLESRAVCDIMSHTASLAIRGENDLIDSPIQLFMADEATKSQDLFKNRYKGNGRDIPI